MTEDEINAALIQQMMEEDENEMLANQMQNEAFGGPGGGIGAGGGGFGFGDDGGANVR